MLGSQAYLRLAIAVRVALALAWLLVTGHLVGFLVVRLFFALSFAYRLREDRLPNAFDLFVVAALLNTRSASRSTSTHASGSTTKRPTPPPCSR